MNEGMDGWGRFLHRFVNRLFLGKSHAFTRHHLPHFCVLRTMWAPRGAGAQAAGKPTQQTCWTVAGVEARALGSLHVVDTGERQEKVRKPWHGGQGGRSVPLLIIYCVPGHLNILFQCVCPHNNPASLLLLSPSGK